MKIAFFGAFGSFDYFKIGGIESFTRRLAAGLIASDCQVDFVIYGAPVSGYKDTGPGIGINYCLKLQDALELLAKNYDQVITVYLHPADRLNYLYFRLKNKNCLRFHQIYTSWPDSMIKRKAMFLDARLYPFNGRLFCVSPRILNQVGHWSTRGVLLLPPVPDSYFIDLDDKPHHGKIKITYIGRTESAKGINDIIYLFNDLRSHAEVEMEIQGFHQRQQDPNSVQIHEWLSRQPSIKYYYTPFEGYSPEIEDNLRRILRDTDILLLPYRRLSSTMDTPLLLLEGMASKCAIITRAFGDIPTIYGPSPFLLHGTNSLRTASERILKARDHLAEERHRIAQRNHELAFGAHQTVRRFLTYLS